MLRPADEIPALVLPPLEYPGILAACADSININQQIMELYLKSILPGRSMKEAWTAGESGKMHILQTFLLLVATPELLGGIQQHACTQTVVMKVDSLGP